MNQDALPIGGVSDTLAILGIRWFPLWRRDARDLEYNRVNQVLTFFERTLLMPKPIRNHRRCTVRWPSKPGTTYPVMVLQPITSSPN